MLVHLYTLADFYFFKQKPAYEMRISDWSSDVCSSDLGAEDLFEHSRFFFQWHREGFEVPRGATVLATGSGAFPNQAFRVGDNAYGLQFHPEMTLAMIHRWKLGGAHRLARKSVV